MDRLEALGNTPQARQEILGEFATSESNLVTEELLRRNVDPHIYNGRTPKKEIRNYVIGVDYGLLHDAYCAVVGHLDEGMIIWDYMDHKPAEGGGLTYEHIRRDLLKLIADYNPVWVVPDGTGMGMPLVERLINDIKTLKYYGFHEEYMLNGTKMTFHLNPKPDLRTKVYHNKVDARGNPRNYGYIFDYQSKKELVDNFIVGLQRNMIKVPPKHVVPVFWKEAVAFSFEYSNNNRIIYGTQREHDDAFIAACLMVMGMREQPIVYQPPMLGGMDYFTL